jgi:hypothetical protein
MVRVGGFAALAAVRRRIAAPIRIDCAKAAVAGKNGRPAGIDRLIFTIPEDTAAIIGDCAPGGLAIEVGIAGPHIEAQRDGQNRDRKRQFKQKDFHAGSLGSRVRKATCGKHEKNLRSSGGKIEARKTVEDGDFCARWLFRR